MSARRVSARFVVIGALTLVLSCATTPVQPIARCPEAPDACLEEAQGAIDSGDPTAAVTHLRNGCDAGALHACVRLGHHEQLGAGIPPNHERALEAFRRGCDGGVGEGCLRLGRALPLGDAREAAYARACALGASDWACKPTEERQASLIRDAIANVIRSHHEEVRECYQQRLAVRVFEGKVPIIFEIDSEGAVTNPLPVGEVIDAPLIACMLRVIRTYRYPSPNGGGVVTVTFPWIFKMSERTPPPPRIEESCDAGDCGQRGPGS